MIKVSSDADRVLVAKLDELGQSHVFSHWDDLSTEEQKGLLAQLHSFDLAFIGELITGYREGAQRKLRDRVRRTPDTLPLPQSPGDESRRRRALEAGEAVLRGGKVAILMTAGGLGSRMGAREPKGLLSIGPVSGRNLFRIHADKIRALGKRYRTSFPLFVLTAPAYGSTPEVFRENDFYGLNRQDVRFLEQDVLPVIDRRGRFVFGAPDRLATRPDGHGAALALLLREESFRQLEMRGIEHVFFFQDDNPLVRIADPVFLGHHVLEGAEMSSKTVCKVDPGEKIGVFCQCDGTLSVVEYSELSPEEQEMRRPDGRLQFSAGNAAIHLLSIDFLRRIRDEGLTLPYHAVEKVTAVLGRDGKPAAPRRPNTVAFERFVFDALAWSRKTLIVETERESEFAPIKNLTGRDSPDGAREAMSRLHHRWLAEAGARFPGSANGAGNGVEPPVEISPLFALDVEELKKKIELPLEVTSSLFLE